MNLFVVGWRAAAGSADAEAALARLLEKLPFFPDCPVERAASRLAAAAWVRPRDLPYAHVRGDSFALFSGRPFRWTDDEAADGRAPIDARFFAEPSDRWVDAIDGRFASVSYNDDTETLELVTDAVGAYPLYAAEVDGTRWFSNSAAALRELTGDKRLRLDSVAGLVGGGWPLEGHPIWNGIERVEPGAVLRLTRDAETSRRLLQAEELARLPGRGLDPDASVRRLRAATAALADWPGRTNVVPVTGGRDSRVVLAAALAAGLEFESVTGGAPDDPDVRVGQKLAAVAGARHSLIPPDPHGSMWTDHRRAARVVRLTAGGTASLADAAGFPLGHRDDPLALWHSGQGGEIGRAYYGSGDGLDAAGLTRRLYDAFTARRPHRRELLSEAGRDIVEHQLRSWVDMQLAAGVAAIDVPDMFYVDRRMKTWAAPTHGCVEYVRDTTSPLWSRRVIADLLAPPADDRARAAYHDATLPLLEPQLAGIEYADGGPHNVAGKIVRELRRRARARRSAPGADRFDPILADVRDQVLSAESHPAWGVLDRGRCETLLSRKATELDEMSRYYVWRLATLFVR